MSHSYAQNHLHVVFSTKERKKLIDAKMQPKLWSYLAGIGRNHGCLVLANGGIEDHVHLLIQLPPVLTLADAISLFKSNSSRWMNEHGLNFAWQEGYGAFPPHARETRDGDPGVFRKRVEDCHSREVHCESGAASSEADV